ncbi:hypothetical protein AB0F81_14910 [Actinoplanes sp. NPDC024001]|uniref:LppU/SCO3897 family protein n=1 Tax=Actinoplanes sp. NPDC024001 TaxID=3154598 RepID=UPI0033EFC16B
MTDPVVPTQPATAETSEPAAPETPARKKPVGKVLGILGGLLIIVVIAALTTGLGNVLRPDPTGDAKAGDCLAITSAMGEKESEVKAELAECSAADAKYAVVGRVDGVQDVKSTACDATFDAKLEDGEEGYVVASPESGGYLLCLKANA